MIVVDASLLLLWVVSTPQSADIGRRIATRDAPLQAPELVDLEVVQALRRYVARRELTVPQAEAALRDFRSLSIERHGHEVLLPRVWALRATHSAYDAAYLALAEGLDAPLWTADGRLARSHGHRAQIEYLG